MNIHFPNIFLDQSALFAFTNLLLYSKSRDMILNFPNGLLQKHAKFAMRLSGTSAAAAKVIYMIHSTDRN